MRKPLKILTMVYAYSHPVPASIFSGGSEYVFTKASYRRGLVTVKFTRKDLIHATR